MEAPLSYSRFVVALNRTAKYLGKIITASLQLLNRRSPFLKFTDATDIPVCLNKNGKDYRTMNDKLRGLFVADAGYVSEKLQQDFFLDGERRLLTAVRANMKKLATDLEVALVRLRMRIEIHFRVLKGCYGLVTSWPRSIDGYLTRYLASITAHLLN